MNANLILYTIGDRFPEGRFTERDSVFEKAVNFIWKDKVVSVVHEPLSSGPYTIVEWGMPVRDIEILEVEERKIIINDAIHIWRKDSHMYHSDMEMTELEEGLLRRNLAFIHKHWIQKLPEKSLGFLLDPCREIMTDSAFEYNYMEQMHELYANLINDSSLKNILAFRGYGYGQTPSGDDFIIGYMMGLQILIALGKNELSKLLECIYTDLSGRTSNRLVNLYAWMAFENRFAEHWKYFLAAFTGMELNHANSILEPLLAVGETSGADTLVGFVSSLDSTLY